MEGAAASSSAHTSSSQPCSWLEEETRAAAPNSKARGCRASAAAAARMKAHVWAAPDDLLVEVLARVPSFLLFRLRSVSRRWGSVLRDPAFLRRHAILPCALLPPSGGASRRSAACSSYPSTLATSSSFVSFPPETSGLSAPRTTSSASPASRAPSSAPSSATRSCTCPFAITVNLRMHCAATVHNSICFMVRQGRRLYCRSPLVPIARDGCPSEE